MKTSFSPQFFRMPGEAEAASAASQAAIGLAQTIGGWIQQRKATKALEKLQSPQYTQNKSILDYYNQALQRYGVSPTDSALYKRQQQNIDRGVAGAIGQLQDRRSGQAGISSILRASNDAKLNAEVAAESQKNQRFGELGGATQLKAGEDDKVFQYNQYMPFERKYNLLAMKASGGNQVMNSGISNAYGGAQNYSNMLMLQNAYGGTPSGGSSGRALGRAGAGVGAAASDIRVKENYFIVGQSPSGINIYEFSYKGSSKRYSGVMAQEVPWAALEVNGVLWVDYSKTDVQFKEIK